MFLEIDTNQFPLNLEEYLPQVDYTTRVDLKRCAFTSKGMTFQAIDASPRRAHRIERFVKMINDSHYNEQLVRMGYCAIDSPDEVPCYCLYVFEDEDTGNLFFKIMFKDEVFEMMPGESVTSSPYFDDAAMKLSEFFESGTYSENLYNAVADALTRSFINDHTTPIRQKEIELKKTLSDIPDFYLLDRIFDLLRCKTRDVYQIVKITYAKNKPISTPISDPDYWDLEKLTAWDYGTVISPAVTFYTQMTENTDITEICQTLFKTASNIFEKVGYDPNPGSVIATVPIASAYASVAFAFMSAVKGGANIQDNSWSKATACCLKICKETSAYDFRINATHCIGLEKEFFDMEAANRTFAKISGGYSSPSIKKRIEAGHNLSTRLLAQTLPSQDYDRDRQIEDSDYIANMEYSSWLDFSGLKIVEIIASTNYDLSRVSEFEVAASAENFLYNVFCLLSGLTGENDYSTHAGKMMRKIMPDIRACHQELVRKYDIDSTIGEAKDMWRTLNTPQWPLQ